MDIKSVKALLHYNVLDKVRLTFIARGQNADERWRTLEVGGGTPNGRCRSLVVAGGRRRTQRVGESF